jgi:hypothetical protein
VRVTEQADPNPVALVNAATIPHAALEHRLRPGDRLEFTVSATNRAACDHRRGRGLLSPHLRLDGSTL